VTMPEQIHQLTDAKFTDMHRYASAIVMLGVDPDNPSVPRVDAVQMLGRPQICLLAQAAMLRDIANKLESAHGPSQC